MTEPNSLNSPPKILQLTKTVRGSGLGVNLRQAKSTAIWGLGWYLRSSVDSMFQWLKLAPPVPDERKISFSYLNGNCSVSLFKKGGMNNGVVDKLVKILRDIPEHSWNVWASNTGTHLLCILIRSEFLKCELQKRINKCTNTWCVDRINEPKLKEIVPSKLRTIFCHIKHSLSCARVEIFLVETNNGPFHQNRSLRTHRARNVVHNNLHYPNKKD